MLPLVVRVTYQHNVFLRASTCNRRASSTSKGSFRRKVPIEGVTIVTNVSSAKRAIQELRRLGDRVHAWDTETVGIDVGAQSPVVHGRVLCATCYCGDDVDFGNGPRLFVDNDGPAAGLIQKHFKSYFEDRAFKKVFHNYSFDTHMFRRLGVNVRGFYADTLHLARMYDTSLASWEGQAAKKQSRSQAVEEEGPRPLVHPAGSGGTSRKVVSVSFGRKPIETPVRIDVHGGGSAGLGVSSMLHTEALQAPSPAVPLPLGYGLKQLASHFGIAGSENGPSLFPQLFGVGNDASEQAHNSPEVFPRWVKYSTADAMLTYNLFIFLQGQLAARPWFSHVHARPIDVVLRDKKVAEELWKDRDSLAQIDTKKSMWDLYELYLRDFGECLADLERVGIGVDASALRRIEAEATKDMMSCEKDVADSFGSVLGPGLKGAGQLNPNAKFLNTKSSQQLQVLLFGGVGSNRLTNEVLPEARSFPVATSPKNRFEINSLGLEPSPMRRNITKAGWPSVSSSTLRELAGTLELRRDAYTQLRSKGFTDDDADQVVFGLKQLGKANRIKSLLSGFTTPLLRHGEETGRIHPSWAFDTSTGRLACRRPNLQNLPAVHQDMYRIRDAFIAQPKKVFIVADYTQLEMRVLAHMANSATMIDKLTRGGDFHSEVAVEIFPKVEAALRSGEIALDEISGLGRPTVKALFGRERTQAKAVNFSIVYGKEASTLAEDLGIPTFEAENLIEAWYRRKPEVRRWQESVVKQSTKHKRMLSLLGRWRTLPFLDERVKPEWRRRSERAAVNFGIQGSAADIVIAAMLRVARNEELAKLGFILVQQVHDEFVFEGPQDRSADACEVVRKLMTDPFRDHSPNFKLRVPLTVDINVGPSLYAAKCA